MLRRLPLICLLVPALLGLTASAALALSPVVVDCQHHNALTGHYSVAELQRALATIPADIKEYSSCYQIIQQQLFKQAGHHTGGPGGTSGGTGGSFVSAPVLIVLIVILLGGGGFAYAAYRRGSGPGDGAQPPPAAGA